MAGDDDERAIETQRLVQELAEVRKRMQMRAEQPPLRNGSGSYRAVSTVPLVIAAAKTAEAREPDDAREPRAAVPPEVPREVEASKPTGARAEPSDEDEVPPTRRRPR